MIVNLAKFWLVNIVTLDIYGFFTDPERTQTFSTQGAIRTYAGGRQRSVTSPGMGSSWKYTLVELTLSQVVILQGWLETGAVVYARDHRGQAFYATFFAIDVTEKIGTGSTAAYEAGITFLGVDVVEGS